MSQTTREEILEGLRRRYRTAGPEHKRKLLDQAQELLGYHRKSAVRALGAPPPERAPWINTGRPVSYDPKVLLPWLRPIWQATDYACGRRLAAMLPEWIPAYEAHERRLPSQAREKLLAASARTLDRLLEPLRHQGQGRCLTRPGTLLRHQIPIRGSVWDESKPGWLEVDTVALCGGSVAGEFVWMLDGVDYATTWVEVRAIWGRGQAGTLAALQDIEQNLPFALLGLDSDNGGEFLNYHVMKWLQQRPRPVFMTRSRPYKKDDNAHVEQKNWTHIRQNFGYERHDNPEGGRADQCARQRGLWPVAKLFPRHSEGGAQRTGGRSTQAHLRPGSNSPGPGVGQCGGECGNQAALAARKSAAQSLRAQAGSGQRLEKDCCAPAGARLKW